MSVIAAIEHRVIDGDEAGMRLDRWFKAHYPGLGFGNLQKLLRSGQVRVDGKRVDAAFRVVPGQTVRVPPFVSTEDRPQVKAAGAVGDNLLAGAILHEDGQVLVFDKPPGLSVQGGSGVVRHVDQLLEHWRDRHGRKPRLVHRLDRETSGVLVVAKTRTAAAALAKSFALRETRKIYFALVAGVPRPAEGRISTYLAREDAAASSFVRVARHGDRDAEHAVTHYRVADQMAQKLAFLVMRPLTGRTHQLRAHAAHVGHPIIGDPKYFFKENWELPGGLQKRLHLHARRLVIPHPSGGTLDVVAPLPPHMRQSWSVLAFDETAGDEIGETL